MKTGTALFLTAGLVAGAVFIHGRRYYQGIDTFKYGLVGLGMEGEQFTVGIGVQNPTGFTYPVPMMFFNVYDKQGNYYGLLNSNRQQYIYPGLTKLDAYLLPSFAALVAPIVSLIMGEKLELMLDGAVNIWGFSVPLKIKTTDLMPYQSPLQLTP